MVKGLERGVEIEQIVLLEKTGGRSDWRRTETTRDGSPRSDARVSERSGGRQS
jgi:hypothetical protein